jgi:hypothetical protein
MVFIDGIRIVSHPTPKAWKMSAGSNWDLSYETLTSETMRCDVREKQQEDPQFALSLYTPDREVDATVDETSDTGIVEHDDDTALSVDQLVTAIEGDGAADGIQAADGKPEENPGYALYGWDDEEVPKSDNEATKANEKLQDLLQQLSNTTRKHVMSIDDTDHEDDNEDEDDQATTLSRKSSNVSMKTSSSFFSAAVPSSRAESVIEISDDEITDGKLAAESEMENDSDGELQTGPSTQGSRYVYITTQLLLHHLTRK